MDAMVMGIYGALALASVGAGVSTVLFGFGGGFVVVPLLYHAVRVLGGEGSATADAAMQVAVATSACVMVVSSALATKRHAKRGNLVRAQLWPLAGWIALGSVAGAAMAMALPGAWVRWAFVVYMVVSIADCVLRPGFVHSSGLSATGHQPPPATTAALGLGIGTIAAGLGVGGSVMTVPLMRRRGLSMTVATAMASPLTLPVGVAGAITYMLVGAQQAPVLPGPHWGYVDLWSLGLLVVGSWLGMRCASPWIGRIPDRLHAQIYVGLLVMVLLAMLW
ncbi:MAG: sulfite exporter TauE/SafE family protein [Acidovorax sp.]|jgi:uncharacterized membrane protein YfcA|nr:sulfite exporter TauE/SafE family protein [Acidovorax sp.]MDR3005183.1 sulfite exporter TauE/SafE family protein [Acidovorax sp.]